MESDLLTIRIEEAIQAYIDAYNETDIPTRLDLLDDQIIFENVSNTAGIIKTTTKDEFRQLAVQSADSAIIADHNRRLLCY